MTQYAAEFGALWDRFIYSLRARLVKERETQPLTHSVCSLILNDEKLCWGTDYNECGKWLNDYREKDPINGELIFSIIMDNVKFSTFEEKKRVSFYSVLKDYILPIALAAIGLIISAVLDAPVWARFAATLLPEFAGFLIGFMMPPAKSPVSVVDDYIMQIAKFKNVITDILNGQQIQ